jgi:hypothetical protein
MLHQLQLASLTHSDPTNCPAVCVQVNPYEPYIDYYSGDVDPTPLLNAPEPKRRFIPSKWEEQK